MDNLFEDLQEEFSDLQETLTWAHFDRSVMEPDPAVYLQEEIDMQEWQKHIQLSIPMSTINNPSEPTCLCTYASRRQWKNQHGEGTYIHTNSYMAHSWSDQDLEEMSKVPIEVPEYILQKPQPPAKESRDDYSTSVRVQISMKEKGTNVKGRYANFEIPNGDLLSIFQVVFSLLKTFPKQPRKLINHYTRVQLQNKVNGKMQGGRNLSLHNATPEEVVPVLQAALDEQGWLVPKSGAGVEKVTSQKEKPFFGNHRLQSEEGLPRPGNHYTPGQGGRGVIYQSQKTAKLRASLLAEIEALA